MLTKINYLTMSLQISGDALEKDRVMGDRCLAVPGVFFPPASGLSKGHLDVFYFAVANHGGVKDNQKGGLL